MDVQPHLLNLSAYINQNLEKDLPLSSLAKRVGLSPFHFHRKFGAYFGESLHQHIKRLRLERAAFALVHGNKPVREIARESGYKTVSAFSHAFSGFAGQSPTRYRNHGSGEAGTVAISAEPVARPAWIGTLPEQPFAFVRARGEGRGRQPAMRDAMNAIVKLISPLPSSPTRDQIRLDTHVMGSLGASDASRHAAHERRPIEFVAATTDFYGIAKAGPFRVDLGLDANRIPAERTEALGQQILAGARYARFDLRCSSDELVERAYAAFLHGLEGADESTAQGACFVRYFDEADLGDDALRDYRLFVPLA